MQPKPENIHFYRPLMLSGGVAYLLWWVLVELLMPGSYNPLPSRIFVASLFVAIYFLSYVSKWVVRHLSILLNACLWILTFHFYYLFYRNGEDINWVVGTYITVIAATACIQRQRSLVAYSILVLSLSGLLAGLRPNLLHTIFLPGVLTILTFAYFVLKNRLKLSAENFEKTQWFQNLFDSAFEGLLVSENGIVIEANESLSKILGYGSNELHGKSFVEFVHSDFHRLVFEKLVAKNEDAYEVTGIKKDGSPITLEIRGKTYWEDGRELRLTAISDITLKKKNEHDRVLYEASQQAIRVRDEFLSIASHEIKTPITNIKLQTQMAARNIRKNDPLAFSPERITKFIEVTERQADRLTKLVEDMLDMSRISAGRMQMEWIRFDLVDLVKEVAQSFQELLQQSNCELELFLPEKSLILGDRFRIEQALTNLLSNAMKYGKENPIRISVENRVDEVIISVEDQGIGVQEQDLERIFERFERAISSNEISGLGLGLYICRHIVEAHGGTISVKSQPGKGSIFTIILPSERS